MQLNDREKYLINSLGLRIEDVSEEILKLIKYALASHEYYLGAIKYVKDVLQCN